MFVEPCALPPVPDYARVDDDILNNVRARLIGGAGTVRSALDRAFRAMERRQPAIASFVAHDLADIEGPAAQGVGYYLAVLVVDAFEEAFGGRLGCVELSDLHGALDCLIADGEVRVSSASFYSEDALALGQPALMKLLRAEIERTLPAADGGKEDPSQLDTFYETLLVLIVALTQAVVPSR
ncbi:MAG TPA: hypothetical protein VJV78_04720 [Polyangiales bacterium]|nr:hypothetical protein [Polyangiales bacterium]